MDAWYPTVVRRYMSTAIDGWLIFIAVALPGLLDMPEDNVNAIRIVVLVVGLLLYEPIFSTRWCTFGQLITRIRVRSAAEVSDRIPIWAGYVRYAIKIVLGIISLFTVPFTRRGVAIHDIIVESVVIRI